MKFYYIYVIRKDFVHFMRVQLTSCIIETDNNSVLYLSMIRI